MKDVFMKKDSKMENFVCPDKYEEIQIWKKVFNKKLDRVKKLITCKYFYRKVLQKITHILHKHVQKKKYILEKTTITLPLHNLSMQTNGLKKSFQRKKECTWRTLLDQIDTKNFRYDKSFQ